MGLTMFDFDFHFSSISVCDSLVCVQVYDAKSVLCAFLKKKWKSQRNLGQVFQFLGWRCKVFKLMKSLLC